MLKLKHNPLATWCEELIHLKRPWCWERLEVGGEGDDRGWDGWMASPTQWTWVWVKSRSWWWTGKPGMLQSMGSERVRHDWVTELNCYICIYSCTHCCIQNGQPPRTTVQYRELCSMLSSNLICKIIWKRLGFIVNMLGRNIRKTLITWFGFKYDLKQASQVTLVVKDSPANAGDTGDEVLVPGSRRSPGGGHGNSLPYSCLENPLDREPGGQQFIRSQRVGHDWSNLAGLRVLHIITHR